MYSEFIKQSIFRINENTERIIKCLNNLTEEALWNKPNNSSNSVGNLILHLCGNISQYIISSLGGKKDERERDKEFSTTGYNKEELFRMLKNTVNCSISIINELTNDDLLKVRKVQGFKLSGIGIIIHVIEHYSYHTGQIAFWTKICSNKDLGFYAGINLNKKNMA